MQTQVPSILQQGGSGDAPVEGCMESGSVEIGLGSIRTHPSTSPRIGLRRRHQGRRYESKTLNDSKQTGIGRYRASTKKWRLSNGVACECGEPEQTADHIINSCTLHRPPSEAGLFKIGPLTRAWLQQTDLTI